MQKTETSLKRRSRLRKTAAKRKVSKSRSLYAVKKRVMKAKSKKPTLKIKSPSKKPMMKVKKVKIVTVQPVEQKPSCGCSGSM
jgi:hypothetical protein